jgi:hypothetical protein
MLSHLSSVLAQQPDQVDWSVFAPHDWQQFVKAARAHGVAPLIWYTLENIGWPAAIPVQVRAALHQSFYQTTAQNMLIYQDLERILDALQDIPVVVLKGAALANTLYPHIGTRPMVDIDLLVTRSAITESLQSLHMLNYIEPIPEIAPRFNSIHRYHVCLKKQVSNNGALIEIHWQLIGGDTDRRVPSMNWFWERIEPWSLHPQESDGATSQNSGAAYQLNPLAHILYLAAHLILQHGSTQKRLIWLYDLHLLITRYGDILDWTAIMKHARAFHWDIALNAALKNTHQYFGTVLPEHIEDRILSVHRTDMQDMTMPEMSTVSRATLLKEELSNLTWRGRYYLVRSHLFPSPTYLRWRYQPQRAWLWPLYYPYRWVDIAGTALRAMIESVRKSEEAEDSR